MAVMPVVIYGNKILRQPSKKIKKINSSIKNLVSDMWDTINAYKGIGLAAPQVGISKQLVIIDLSYTKKFGKYVLINPVITKKSKKLIDFEEGCLSLPEIYHSIKRPDKVTVTFTDLNNKKNIINADDILARVIQHEIDHLYGRLFIDKLSKEDFNRLKPELNKLKFLNKTQSK